MRDINVIFAPIITEKHVSKQDSGIYAFWVNPKATKSKIKEAVIGLFGIKPLSIKTILVKGGVKKLWNQGKIIKRTDRKKAIIRVKEGEKIKFLSLDKK